MIGDGALSAGMAYEAMNNAAAAGNRLIVILNDNDMSIAPLVEARRNAPVQGRRASILRPARWHRSWLARCRSRCTSRHARWKNMLAACSPAARSSTSSAFIMSGRSTGTTSGRWSRSSKMSAMPTHGLMLVHVVTQKGKGYGARREQRGQISRCRSSTLSQACRQKRAPSAPAYQNVFGETLAKLADIDPKIAQSRRRCRLVPASTSSPPRTLERAFDVGIAEQHAVTFAAGLAAQGIRPFVAIYSTFLQRAYDQVVHDVAIQNLPVRFAMDAGLVGADGATHAGLVRPRIPVHAAELRGDGAVR